MVNACEVRNEPGFQAEVSAVILLPIGSRLGSILGRDWPAMSG